MSLVNDMLRDLEDREDHNSGKAVGASPSIARPNTSMSRGSKLSAAIGCSLVVMAVGLWGWHSQWWQPPAEQPLAQHTDPEANAISAPEETHSPAKQMDSTPQGHEENPAEAVTLAQAAATVPPEEKQVETEMKAQVEASVPTQTEVEPKPETIIAELPTSNEQAADQPVEANPTPAAKEPMPQQPLPEAKQLASTITPSASTLDQRAADTARQLIKDGQLQRARSLLEGHLQQYPNANKSTLALAELHLNKGDHSALTQLLTNSTALAPAHATLIKARSMLAQQRPEDAQNLLEQNPPSVDQHPDYHALLAGLYHKRGQHRSAATLYRRLVEVQQDSSIYWLGLAVALDALKDRNALKAFQRTQTLNNNPDVQTYIEKRIAALSSNR